MAIGYFNNDTWLDIVVANRAIRSLSVYLATGDENFAKPSIYPTDSHSDPHMVAVGDLNNDQILDIALANFYTNNINIFIGDGNGTFTSQQTISTNASRPIYIHLADLDRDSRLDIVTANYGTNSISIFYSDENGNLSYSKILLMDYDSLPYSVITGDLNNDHQLDLIIANYGTNNIQILLANGNRTYPCRQNRRDFDDFQKNQY